MLHRIRKCITLCISLKLFCCLGSDGVSDLKARLSWCQLGPDDEVIKMTYDISWAESSNPFYTTFSFSLWIIIVSKCTFLAPLLASRVLGQQKIENRLQMTDDRWQWPLMLLLGWPNILDDITADFLPAEADTIKSAPKMDIFLFVCYYPNCYTRLENLAWSRSVFWQFIFCRKRRFMKPF